MSTAVPPVPPTDHPAAPPPPAPAAPPASLLLAMVTDWAQLDELRLACRTSEPNYRRHHALSALLACFRAEMVAALLAQRARTPTTPMDGTTRALVHGKLCYPRVGWDILPLYLQNHK